MAYGKNGSMWLAGAVRTLQKRVEWLEAATNGVNSSVSQYKLDGDFKIRDTIPKARVPRHTPASDLEHSVVNSADAADDDLHDFKQVLSDDDEFADSTVTLATVRNKDFDGANADLCVPRQKAAHEMDFFDVDLRVYSKTLLKSWIAKISRRATKWKLLPFAMCPLLRLWKWWSLTLSCMRHLLP